MAKPLEYNATLVERIDQTDLLAIFRVKPDDVPAKEPWMVPGQYCVLGLNNEDKPALGSVRRAMSIASAPDNKDAIEFYVRYVNHPESDNPLTHLLWNLKAGDRVYMRTHAVGHFTIEHTVGLEDNRHCIMVAAGTGIAPFISIVRGKLQEDPKADLSKLTILHGASYPGDLGYETELMAAAKSNGLHYHGSVSRPNEAPEWQGDQGRVEDYFLDERISELETRLGLPGGGFTPEHAYVMVCGLTGTVGQCITRLIGRGFVPDHRKFRKALVIDESVPSSLFYEQYDTTPPVDVKDPAVVAPLQLAWKSSGYAK